MNTWLIIILSYLLVGFICYMRFMAVAPPQDDDLPKGLSQISEPADLDPEPLPFSMVRYLVAIPGLVLMCFISPFLLTLFYWQKIRRN